MVRWFLNVFVQVVNKAISRLTTLGDDCPYKEILSKFPEITRTSITHKQIAHGVEHVIETTCSLVSNKARRLCPEKFKAAKQELEYMMQEGLYRPSKALGLVPYISCRKRIAIDVRMEITANSMR